MRMMYVGGAARGVRTLPSRTRLTRNSSTDDSSDEMLPDLTFHEPNCQPWQLAMSPGSYSLLWLWEGVSFVQAMKHV